MSAEGTEHEKLSARLAPERIRSTLAFAGVFQVVHEMLKRTILDDLRGFYGHSPLEEGVWLWGRDQYDREVTTLDKRPFRASLVWLQDAGVLDDADVARLDEIYQHRHDLTHELVQFVIDVNRDPDPSLLTDAVELLGRICRFWTQVEIDSGALEVPPDVDADTVQPMRMIVLHMCVEAYLDAASASTK